MLGGEGKESGDGGGGGGGGKGCAEDFDSLAPDKQAARWAEAAYSNANLAAGDVRYAEDAAESMAGGIPDHSAAAALAQVVTDTAVRSCRAYAVDAANAARDARRHADKAAAEPSQIHVEAADRAYGAAARARSGSRIMCQAAVAAACAKHASAPDAAERPPTPPAANPGGDAGTGG